MIQIGDKILRNLEEQVLKNKQDIAKHYEIDRVLANLGIKIVGQLSSAEELPDPLTYSGEYGDAYAVGDRAKVESGEIQGGYTYYVFTRPDPNAGINTNQWLDVGKISIAGPQGPQGEQGLPGVAGQSTRWYTNISVLPEGSEFKSGDMLLTTGSSVFGNVYIYSDVALPGRKWVYVTNIKGPQGVQGIKGEQGEQGPQGPVGPQGPTGDVGGFIKIYGILNNIQQLPTPASLGDLTVAYLVGASAPYDLYIQVGSTSAYAIWTNMGPLNAATLVMVGGQYQNFWNADSKVDKVTATSSVARVYAVSTQGNQEMYTIATAPTVTNIYALAMYMGEGAGDTNAGTGYLLSNTPTRNYHVATKKYVDTEIANQHIAWKHLTGNSDTFVSFDLSELQEGKVYQLEVLPGSELISDVIVNSTYSSNNTYTPGSTIVYKPSATTYTLKTDRAIASKILSNVTTIGACTYDDGGPLDLWYRFIEIK